MIVDRFLYQITYYDCCTMELIHYVNEVNLRMYVELYLSIYSVQYEDKTVIRNNQNEQNNGTTTTTTTTTHHTESTT